jgi:hypothetical protein
MNPSNLQYRVNFLTYHRGTCTNLHFEYINYSFLKEKKIVDESIKPAIYRVFFNKVLLYRLSLVLLS